MSTAYQAPHLGSYDSHVLPPYPSALSQITRTNAALSEAVRTSQHSRYPQPAYPSYTQTQSRNPASGASHYSSTSRHSTRPSTPNSEANMTTTAVDGAASRRGSAALVLHSLQIPACINPKGGNLADFAAQITCLFWFESMDTLRAAENIRSRPPTATVPRLTKYALPYTQFKKWAYSVLSTTQVTQNVILLALLFIYRLKTTNPSVKGRSGSEYRLLTVALMLGNKFLDDNTYTNKTWAEVSAISVQEIHVMEVEFLSNMRYSLLATKQEWEEWLVKLACFSEYYERAQKQPTSPIANSSPSGKAFNSPLLSPTGTLHAAPSMPPLTPSGTTIYSPSSAMQPNGQTWPQALPNNVVVSPLSGKVGVNMNGCRKRSPEDDPSEPPAKRASRIPQGMPIVNMRPSSMVEPVRLPVPNLTLNTNPAAAQVLYPPANTVTPQSNLSLPPLVPGVRAMATVYQPTSVPSSAVGQLSIPATSGPAMQQGSIASTAVVNHPTAIGYGTPTKRHSPGSLSAYASSPLAEQFPAGSAIHTPLTHTPISHSPGIYLQQRSSPYKPIRHVNTLLYPPPSASLHEYHLSVPTAQMHYQPLGRRNDLRTGVVPEFMALPYRAAAQVQGQAQSQLQSQGHGPYLN